MTRKGKLFVAWGVMYVICAILGFINTDNGLLQAIFALVSMGFFLPGGVLLYEAVGEKDSFLPSISWPISWKFSAWSPIRSRSLRTWK